MSKRQYCGDFYSISSVQSLSHVWLFATPWTAAHQASLSITNSQSLLKLMSIESVMPSKHLILIPFSSRLQSFPASGSFQINQFFASGGQSFSFFVSPSNEYSVLISFRMNWFDLLAVQGTLKSFIQHHSLKVYRINGSLLFSWEKKSKRWAHPVAHVGSHCTVSRPAAFMESWNTH